MPRVLLLLCWAGVREGRTGRGRPLVSVSIGICVRNLVQNVSCRLRGGGHFAMRLHIHADCLWEKGEVAGSWTPCPHHLRRQQIAGFVRRLHSIAVGGQLLWGGRGSVDWFLKQRPERRVCSWWSMWKPQWTYNSRWRQRLLWGWRFIYLF